MLSVQSGAAPLAPRLVELVSQAETVLGTDVRRAVVIDAEGCTFDLLESFAAAQRVLITPLKPSRVPSLQLTYSRGSYYRPYRDHDELRIAQATLVHKSSGRSSVCAARTTFWRRRSRRRRVWRRWQTISVKNHCARTAAAGVSVLACMRGPGSRGFPRSPRSGLISDN